jgi:hypothetical protein
MDLFGFKAPDAFPPIGEVVGEKGFYNGAKSVGFG